MLLSLIMFMVIQTTAFFRHHAGTGDLAYRSAVTTSAVSAAEYKATLRKCWKYVLSVFLVFLGSLTVFPSVSVIVSSQLDGNIGWSCHCLRSRPGRDRLESCHSSELRPRARWIRPSDLAPESDTMMNHQFSDKNISMDVTC